MFFWREDLYLAPAMSCPRPRPYIHDQVLPAALKEAKLCHLQELCLVTFDRRDEARDGSVSARGARRH